MKKHENQMEKSNPSDCSLYYYYYYYFDYRFCLVPSVGSVFFKLILRVLFMYPVLADTLEENLSSFSQY